MPTTNTPGITVIFLLYHSPQYVAGLMDAIGRQRHPRFSRQEEWMDVIFMDNGSTDNTGAVLREHLAVVGSRAHYQVVTNPVNIGYARAVNKAFGLIRTPFALTCHCDCLFGSDDYVATMWELLQRYPDAATITGKPAIPHDKRIPFAEKVNLVTYLMDIIPSTTQEELVSVGFSEGRCDGFRLAAVEAAGFYDTSHHSAGEDQVLCAGMRRAGYRIYQAPALRYTLSVSDEQDTVGKLVRHLRLFGERHPILLLKGGAGVGVVGGHIGANRRSRRILRMTQLGSPVVYLWTLAALLTGMPLWTWVGPLAATFLAKLLLFFRHLRVVRLRPHELVVLFAVQPAFDVAYAWGFACGLWLVASGRWRPRAA